MNEQIFNQTNITKIRSGVKDFHSALKPNPPERYTKRKSSVNTVILDKPFHSAILRAASRGAGPSVAKMTLEAVGVPEQINVELISLKRVLRRRR
jgi:hypothetical protein